MKGMVFADFVRTKGTNNEDGESFYTLAQVKEESASVWVSQLEIIQGQDERMPGCQLRDEAGGLLEKLRFTDFGKKFALLGLRRASNSIP